VTSVIVTIVMMMMMMIIIIIIIIIADSVQQLHVQQSSTYAKPEAASAVLGS